MSTDPIVTDPPLLRDNTQIETYHTTKFTYPSIRTFYRRHPKAAELPTTPAPLPLLVCIHGLGGSVAQFHPLLTSLVHVCSCLAIDLPGCGRSAFEVKSWDAYTTDALVELIEVIIQTYRDKVAGQNVVLIGHSMGSVLCARLASKTAPASRISEHVVGLVGICPVSGPPPEEKVRIFRWLLRIPGWIFDLWRAWDRRGGEESQSVKRFVGTDADKESKSLQHRFNCQSRTPVWRRMAWGAMPTYKDGVAKGGMPGLTVWQGVDVPVFLVGGEADEVTKASEVEKIKAALQNGKGAAKSVPEEDFTRDTSAMTTSAAPLVPNKIEDINASTFVRKRIVTPEVPSDTETDTTSTPTTPARRPENLPEQPRHPAPVIKTVILPHPASHALLYMPVTVRILAAFTSDFLSQNITSRLSLAWQLQYLSKEGKWEVKNLAKWKSVTPVSNTIGPEENPVFVAMKTLREVDETHSPVEFVKAYGGKVSDVVDISHDQPAYDPRGLEKGGIKYHKFATVSKIPPTEAEVDGFIALVDRIRKERKEEGGQKKAIGVHCHYGFNRTGYFIVCYLVERCGYSVNGALDAFAKARPNGIRHSHFRDKIHVRYGLGGSGRAANQ